MTYLSIDVETGGTSTDTSLLSAAFVFCDAQLNEIEYRHYKVKPFNDIFTVTSKGLSINKINLVEHVKEATTYEIAATNLYGDLSRWSNRAINKLIPIGKNIQSDIDYITKYLVKKNTWSNFVSYNSLDITSVLQFLRLKNKIGEVGNSLEDLLVYYGHKIDGIHDALFDARANITVLKEMLK